MYRGNAASAVCWPQHTLSWKPVPAWGSIMTAREERQREEGSGHGSIAVRAISPPWLDENALYVLPVSVGHASLGRWSLYRVQDMR